MYWFIGRGVKWKKNSMWFFFFKWNILVVIELMNFKIGKNNNYLYLYIFLYMINCIRLDLI